MGVLTDIRDFVRDELEGSDLFTGIEVLSEDRGVIANEVARSLQKIGMVAVVMTPSAPAAEARSDIRAPYCDVHVTIQIGETQSVNRTGKRASDLAEAALAILHHRSFPGLSESLVPRDPAIQLVSAPAPLTVLYQVNLRTSAGLRLDPAALTVATPVISAGTPSAVTITCATAGAAIWYTTDGERPSPANGTLYTGAFNAAGLTVKARAGRWGMKVSEMAKAVVS